MFMETKLKQTHKVTSAAAAASSISDDDYYDAEADNQKLSERMNGVSCWKCERELESHKRRILHVYGCGLLWIFF